MDDQSRPVDDQIFQSLSAGYPMHMIWRMSLPAMWDDVAKTLGHTVRFLTETERERMVP